MKPLIAVMPSEKPSNLKPDNTLAQWIGSTKTECFEYCSKNTLKMVNFAHWLSIPELQIVLVFKHQSCVEVIKNILQPTNVA